MLESNSNLPLQKYLGVVVIGRNEGARLERCLESIDSKCAKVVYVDSGSTDNSVETAHRYGAEVVNLDTSIPFCAARARNMGYQRLVESSLQLDFIQFIDGDCEIISDWLTFAIDSLIKLPEHAVVTGWLWEKHPETSIYNRLANLEWNFTGAGDVDAVGGIFMIRRQAFDGIGGFDPTIAAGEEPELCQRLIRKGWRIAKLSHAMAQHDLAMTKFGQWWLRMMRNGYGSMDVARRFNVAKFAMTTRKTQIWTMWLTLTVAFSVTSFFADSTDVVLLALLLSSLWPLRWIRVTFRTWKNGQPLEISMAYAFFMVISFLPQILGQFLYMIDRLRKRSFRLVEYKAPASHK